MYPNPEYRIILRKFVGEYAYGPGDVIAEITNWYNLGWADYVNDVPEAFFTILQKEQEPLADLLRNYEGRAHVQIFRNGTQVFGGWLMEYDGNSRDAVFYCYGYLSGAYWQATDWNSVYIDKKVSEIVSTEWNKAQNRELQVGGVDKHVSLLRWTTVGTIQQPATTTGGAIDLVLPEYKVYHKRLLFLLRELASIAMSDTQNTVVFEVTPAGVFNLWKDRSIDRPDLLLEYGDDQVADFRHMRAPVHKRNRLLGVGSSPGNVLLRKTMSKPSQYANWGLREEALYLAWVRDATELERVVSHRLARATRIDNDLALRFYPNSVTPPFTGSGVWRLTDRARVKINHGTTLIDGYFHTVGAQTTVTRGGIERVQVMFQELVGV